MDPGVVAGIVAGVVSLTVAVISFFSNRASTMRQIRQTQYSQILSKRIELYPLLWKIHITYETNWELEKKAKNRDWAKNYLQELNEFNIKGGVFFSEDLYKKFGQLRGLLYRAVEETKEGDLVDSKLVIDIRKVVYGSSPQEPGLSTYEKDDLGSYRHLSIQRRASDG